MPHFDNVSSDSPFTRNNFLSARRDGYSVHLRRHSRTDTAANEYMQELPESVQQMVGSVYLMLTKGGEEKESEKQSFADLPQNATNFSVAPPVSC